MLISASLSSSSRVVTIGNLPTNSGIKPNFNKSCGNSSLNTSVFVFLAISFFSTPKPIAFFPVL